MHYGTSGMKGKKTNIGIGNFKTPQMITLAKDASSWEVGDQVAMASTDFEQVINLIF